MLAHAIEDTDFAALDAGRLFAPNGNGTASACRRWPAPTRTATSSRGSIRAPARTSRSFPDLLDALDCTACARRRIADPARGPRAVLHGPAAAAQPQERCGEAPSDYPAHLRAYDLLAEGDDDLRALPFVERRARLERSSRVSTIRASTCRRWFRSQPGTNSPPRAPIRRGRRRRDAQAIEGLMLKRRDAPTARPAEGPVVQMEARSAHRRCRADVCAARPRQALVLSIPTTRSAFGTAATSWCRSARPISASPMKN